MKNWLNKNISYFRSAAVFFICTLFTQVNSMDEPPPETFNRLAWLVILSQGAAFIDRSMICDFSQVSKRCHKLVLDTKGFREKYNLDYRALVLQNKEYKKQFFMERYPYLNEIPGLVWNEHGTVCAKVTCGSGLTLTLCKEIKSKTTCSRNSRVLIECCNFLNPHDIAYKEWPYFHKELPHKPGIRFDGLQDVYFYAYGSGFAVSNDVDAHVIEYRLSSKASKPDAFICVTKIADRYVKLSTFLEFPILLEAFLNSSVTRHAFGIAYKVFMLEGVTLPDNYRMCQKYHKEWGYKSFKALPKEIRKAIVAHYRFQNSIKKKKKKWIIF